MRMPSRRRAVRVGLALSNTEMYATWDRAGGARGTLRVPVTPYPADNGGWPGLARALKEVKRAVDATGPGRLAVALLSPLVEVRRLEVPPLSEADLLLLLSRGGGRYFMGARGAQVVGVLVPHDRGRGARSVLAAAAPARALEALHDAAQAVGWTVSVVTPAEGAWAAAAGGLWPALGHGAAHVLARQQSRTTLVEMHEARVVGLRHFRPGAADAALIADAIMGTPGTAPDAVGAFGVSGDDELSAVLASRGLAVAAAPEGWREEAETAALLAAAFARRSAGPRLWTERARGRRSVRARRATWAVAAAAAFLFVAAAWVRLWGVERDLRVVEAQRDTLRPQVSATLIGRTSVQDASRELAALAGAARDAPRWAPVLADLSARLPADAYLSGFHAHGDSLTVDGLASSAARAFDAMEKSPRLAGVRAPAPVRRESVGGRPPMERFTIAAVLREGAQAATLHESKAAAAAGGRR